jgi:hypothetical protein
VLTISPELDRWTLEGFSAVLRGRLDAQHIEQLIAGAIGAPRT